jgi:hypothetical protein
MDFVEYILAETDWLYTRIYQNDFLFFDLWSIVHLWCGFVILLLLRAFRIRPAIPFLFMILFLYELAEILFIYFAFDLFRPETIKDQVTDLVVGMLGGFLSAWLLSYAVKHASSHRYLVLSGMMMLASLTYAFPWVGFYQYHYDISFYNTPGINVFAYVWWTLGGCYLLGVYWFFRKKKFILRLALTWIIYTVSLLVAEYFGYYVFKIHENSDVELNPLIFGLIHGTRTMHIFYLICPFLIILLYSIAVWLMNRIIWENDDTITDRGFRAALCWK